MRFGKYHGIGNDFLVVDLRGGEPTPSPQDPALVQALCDRRFGVGGDGVLAVLPALTESADARMRVLNSDGGEAEMCGNGIRCVAKYLWERDPALRRSPLTIDTGAGPLTCELETHADAVTAVSVDMGRPRLARQQIPMLHGGAFGNPDERVVAKPLPVAGGTLEVTAVSMGNPHAVVFTNLSGDELRQLAEKLGPAVEHHEQFPKRTNAEFAHLVSPSEIELVVWERGCGITLACGTGACATAVAACLTGRAKPGTDITVRLLGGPLNIRVAEDLSTVTMRGPATHVYDADIDLAALQAARS